MTQGATLQHEAEALSAALPPLMADAERLASTVSLGIHGRRKAGMGESFWQFRRFRDEDPSTAIDWRQSAKSQHLFVREREWEVAQSVWFWRDGSPGMDFRSGTVSKRDRASQLALALEAPMSRNAQFVWFSDFLSPLPALENVFKRFTQSGVGGTLVHIVDPAEEDFPYEGRTRFEAPGGESSETLGRAESVASNYRARFKAHAETVALLARRQGWTYLAHRTDRAPQTALVALYAEMSGAKYARV